MAKNNFIRFSYVGVQMAVLVYLGSELGKYLDEKYASANNGYTAFCVILAVGISIYHLISALPKDE